MPHPVPKKRELAPLLRLPTVDGSVFDVASLRGTFVVVSFLRHAG